jgi:hypothetical protein
MPAAWFESMPDSRLRSQPADFLPGNRQPPGVGRVLTGCGSRRDLVIPIPDRFESNRASGVWIVATMPWRIQSDLEAVLERRAAAIGIKGRLKPFGFGATLHVTSHRRVATQTLVPSYPPPITGATPAPTSSPNTNTTDAIATAPSTSTTCAGQS